MANSWDDGLVNHVLGRYRLHRPPYIAYSLGAAYAQLGDLAEATRRLEQAARTGLPCYPWFARDPLLDPLRRDPQFMEFLSGLEDSWRKRLVRYTSGTR